MTTPDAPTGVRILHADGSVTGPLTLRYVGVENDVNVWVPADDTTLLGRGDKVTVEVMPPRTSLSFPTLWGGEPT